MNTKTRVAGGLILLILVGGFMYITGHIGIYESGEEYLKDRGYIILSSDEKKESYTLQKNLLAMEYMDTWGVQRVKPDKFIGKTIEVQRFLVKNHKLDNHGDRDSTFVWLMRCEGKIIGGYSFPNNSEVLFGGYYGLNGETHEEITGEDYRVWVDRWLETYKENLSIIVEMEKR